FSTSTTRTPLRRKHWRGWSSRDLANCGKSRERPPQAKKRFDSGRLPRKRGDSRYGHAPELRVRSARPTTKSDDKAQNPVFSPFLPRSPAIDSESIGQSARSASP